MLPSSHMTGHTHQSHLFAEREGAYGVLVVEVMAKDPAAEDVAAGESFLFCGK